MSDSPKPKQTTDLNQAYTLIGLVLLVAAIFGYAILPMLLPRGSGPILGEPAPEFALPITFGGEAGNRVRLSDLKGRVVLLDFWASWCAPCREQMPIVDRVARRYAYDEVVVLGINTAETQQEGRALAQSMGLNYPIAFDTGEVALAYGATALPTLAVIDAAGRLTAREQRVLPEAAIEELLAAARGD